MIVVACRAPTQRLVRQLLFLQRLSKTTPAHHADSQPLKAAEATWIKTLEACNAVAGAHAMRRRAEAIESVLDGAPRNVLVTAPGRKLAHEGELTKIGGSTVRPDYFFLFETLSSTELLHTSAPDAQGHFAFKRFLRVLHVEDVELGSGAHEGGGIDRNRIYARRGSIGGRTATSSAAPTAGSRSSRRPWGATSAGAPATSAAPPPLARCPLESLRIARSPAPLCRFQDGQGSLAPVLRRGEAQAQAQAPRSVPQLLLHGRQMSWLLQHHHCF